MLCDQGTVPCQVWIFIMTYTSDPESQKKHSSSTTALKLRGTATRPLSDSVNHVKGGFLIINIYHMMAVNLVIEYVLQGIEVFIKKNQTNIEK